MRCLTPRTVSFQSDGTTIAWSQKRWDKAYEPFKLPCGKCIECRLEYSRSWAVRCVHESKMHENNSFLTLTYSDEYLGDGRLRYRDFQLFMKKLRKLQNGKIGYFVTGEYGEKFKRPHWHSIVFNWFPRDAVFKYSNHRGDRVFSSNTLTELWANGIAEIGSVTFESAAYCARYAAKKLVHGDDDSHDYQPISKKSSHQAIGKAFLEKFYKDIFSHGYVVLDSGVKTAIPRYYEKWLLKNHPDEWMRYVTEVKYPGIAEKIILEDSVEKSYWEKNDLRGYRRPAMITKNETRARLAEERLKHLKKHLKGDI